jgi:sugar (pentulose or hexulose) kinase
VTGHIHAERRVEAKHSVEAERSAHAAQAIRAGRTTLGIELGSTRIKACLVEADDPATVLAVGGHEWQNELVDGVWTYSLDAVWSGLQTTYAELVADAERRHGVRPTSYAAIGVSAMMHGYLAFDVEGKLLTPFRTWRNTSTGAAARELSALFGVNIPLRWSIAHLHQAVLDAEPHVPSIDHLTTLAGYVHERLTGRRVLGVGDASGMFPIDPATGDFDADLISRYHGLVAGRAPGLDLTAVLPRVLRAGEAAGELTAEGAALLDPAALLDTAAGLQTGVLRSGIPLCPPEGDAGTGMVATGAVAPRSGNVSVGTSVFAMVVLDRPLTRATRVRDELDLVTTPAGDPVAMVHCNNGASELGAWAGLFARFAEASGTSRGIEADTDAVYDVLFREALTGEADAGGVLAYNQLAGEPIVGLAGGRPLVVRTPDSRFTLANFMRAQLYGVFGALALGMRLLADEGVALDRMLAHGGVFRTARVAQRLLAGALNVPVAVAATASEGGAWGIAVLAAYLASEPQAAPFDSPRSLREQDSPRSRREQDSPCSRREQESRRSPRIPDARGAGLDAYLAERVFGASAFEVVAPDEADVAGFAAYLESYRAGLAIERAALETLPQHTSSDTSRSTTKRSTTNRSTTEEGLDG